MQDFLEVGEVANWQTGRSTCPNTFVKICCSIATSIINVDLKLIALFTDQQAGIIWKLRSQFIQSPFVSHYSSPSLTPMPPGARLPGPTQNTRNAGAGAAGAEAHSHSRVRGWDRWDMLLETEIGTGTIQNIPS